MALFVTSQLLLLKITKPISLIQLYYKASKQSMKSLISVFLSYSFINIKYALDLLA